MRLLSFALAALLLTSCTLGRHATPSAGSGDIPAAAAHYTPIFETIPKGKIQHVVIVVQENRSFDDLFYEYPGADTVTKGRISTGKNIALQRTSLATGYVIDHSAKAFFAACDGSPPGQNCKNDGFNNEFTANGPNKYPQYAFVPHTESKPYFDMAHEFVLADRMFTSQIDESFVAHQYIVAAQAASTVDLPSNLVYWGCDGGRKDTALTLNDDRSYGAPKIVCFDHQTLGDELDAAHLSWRFYTSKTSLDGGEWSGYQTIRHIRYGPDWKKVHTPQTRFFDDIAKGRLSTVTWITPICANSDHVACGGTTGPSWVTSIVNAVGESPFWDTTAVFVLWDDWGGLYDHVPPPYADYDGLGFRVPLLIISPYAKKDYVSHVQYETSSVLRFIEDQFGLAQLAPSDRRATSPEADAFDFSQPPRPFVPIQAPHDRAFFERQPIDLRRPDEQ